MHCLICCEVASQLKNRATETTLEKHALWRSNVFPALFQPEYPSERKFRNIQGKKFYLPSTISPFSFSQNPSWPITQINILWKTRRNLQFSRTFPSESTHGHHNTPLHHQNRTLKESTSAFPLISTPIHNFVSRSCSNLSKWWSHHFKCY